MTTTLSAHAFRPVSQPSAPGRLRLVGEEGCEGTGTEVPPGLVGYLVLLPEGVDPAALLAANGVRPEIRPLPHDGAPPSPPPGDDPIRIDRERHVVEVDGRELDLTFLEFGLLAQLAEHPHRVHSRDFLVSNVWGYGHVGDGRTVDVHVARVRRKLGEAHRHRIVTVRRLGYKYVPDPR